MSEVKSPIPTLVSISSATHESWEALATPVPQGILIYASDTKKFYVGDGTSMFSELIPINDSLTVEDLETMLNQINAIRIWDDKIDYAVPAIVFGEDNKLYEAVAPSGPSAKDVDDNIIGPKNPVTDDDKVYWRAVCDCDCTTLTLSREEGNTLQWRDDGLYNPSASLTHVLEGTMWEVLGDGATTIFELEGAKGRLAETFLVIRYAPIASFNGSTVTRILEPVAEYAINDDRNIDFVDPPVSGERILVRELNLRDTSLPNPKPVYTSVTYNVPFVSGVLPVGAQANGTRTPVPTVNSNNELYLTTGSGAGGQHGACFWMPIGKAGLLKGYRISLEFKCNGSHYYTMSYNGFSLVDASQAINGNSSGRLYGSRQHMAVPTNVGNWTPIVMESTDPSALSTDFNKAVYNGSSLPRSYPPSTYVNYFKENQMPVYVFSPVTHSVHANMSPEVPLGFEIHISNYGTGVSKHLYIRNLVITLTSDDLPALMDSLGYDIPDPVFS